MFGLLISYLLEQKMPVTNMGEDMGDYDYIPHKNTRGKVKVVQRWPRTLTKPVKVKGKKKAGAEDGTSES